MRAAKSSEFGGKVVSTLDGPIWSKRQHCTDLTRQVTFAVHTEQGKNGTRVRINVTTHQEKEKNRETKKGRRKETEKTGDRF